MIRRILALGAAMTALAGSAGAQTADSGYVDKPRMMLIQADRDWATYYNLASHHSDGERYVDAYVLRAPVERLDEESAWLHARFDCKGETYENLGWFDRNGEEVGARTSAPVETQDMPDDDHPFAAYLKPMRALACYGDAPFDWAVDHSVADAIAAAPAEAARAIAQIEAPPPAMAEPSGPLGYIGLTSWDEGVFVAPGTVTRAQDGMSGEAMIFYANGHLQHVAEGVIRFSWARHEFDCLSGQIATSQRDYYSEDGALVATLGRDAFEAIEADVPWETGLMGYICLEMEPPGYQVVPSRDIAVRGVVDSVAAARGADD